MTKLLNCKRGVAPRVMFLIIGGLVITAFLAFLGVVILEEVLSSFETSPVYTSTMAGPIQSFRATYYMWDYIMVTLLAVFIIGVAVTSHKLKSRPIGFIISFAVAPFYGFISYFMNYYFIELVSPSQLAAVQVYFPITMIICTNLHWIALMAVIVGAIFAYNYHTENPTGGEYLS